MDGRLSLYIYIKINTHFYHSSYITHMVDASSHRLLTSGFIISYILLSYMRFCTATTAGLYCMLHLYTVAKE